MLPPVSLVLSGAGERYVQGLTAFRRGDAGAWLSFFAEAVFRAARVGEDLADGVRGLQDDWTRRAAPPRRDSTAATLIRRLPEEPVVDLAAARRQRYRTSGESGGPGGAPSVRATAEASPTAQTRPSDLRDRLDREPARLRDLAQAEAVGHSGGDGPVARLARAACTLAGFSVGARNLGAGGEVVGQRAPENANGPPENRGAVDTWLTPVAPG